MIKKTNFYKIFIILFICFIILSSKTNAIPNPWVDCKDDINCGAKISGFNFPIKVNDYNIRATKDIMEITFPIDKKRTVTARKSQTCGEKSDFNDICDISGVYEIFPVDKDIKLRNRVKVNVRGEKHKFYVVNFVAETGYYSFYCKQGLTKNDIKYLYKLLEEAEAHN